MKRWMRSAIGVLAGAVVVLMWQIRQPDLVVYCAHDSVYADSVIRDFEQQTGLDVAVKYDTEATKSLGLIELLIAEKQRPRCDVFWNNELLGTLDLAERGVLAAYRGEGHQRMPETCRDPEGLWTGFGARMRVYIVNTNRFEVSLDAIHQQLESGGLSGAAIARPLFGTTLTHYCLLWRELGEEGLKAWHQQTRDRGLNVLTGNSTVKNQVASGGLDFGFTDTDDYFLAEDAGMPVAKIPAELPDGSTIVIPNTVALIKGAPNLDNGTRFMNFLLSEQTELALANSASRQIPLGPVDESQLPEQVRALRPAAARGTALHGLEQIRRDCVAWLKGEETR